MCPWKASSREVEKGKAHRASSPLDLIHSDLMGPFPHPSIGKARYVLTFLDDYSRYTWVFFLRHKSEVFEHLKEFKALVETQSGRNIKSLHTDNGGEYVNRYVQNLCLEARIQLQHTIPYTLQQNGVVERKNISLKEMASCMLHARSLPQNIWDEALNYANYILEHISPQICQGSDSFRGLEW
jgi:transposase InsO family protein